MIILCVCVRCDLRSKPFSKRYSSVANHDTCIYHYDIFLNEISHLTEPVFAISLINWYYIFDISFEYIYIYSLFIYIFNSMSKDVYNSRFDVARTVHYKISVDKTTYMIYTTSSKTHFCTTLRPSVCVCECHLLRGHRYLHILLIFY